MQRLAVTAHEMFTSALSINDGIASMLVAGTFTGTITLQARPLTDVADAAWASDESGWVDLDTLTAPGGKTTLHLAGSWQVRAGAKTSGFTDGTANVFLQVGRALGL